MFEGPDFQPADASNLLHVGRIVPVYRLTTGLTANRLRAAMRAALDRAGHAYPEYLPAGDPRRPRPCRRSPTRSRPPTTRRPSRPATRRSAGSPSTSCSRSSWAWSAGGAPAGRAADRRRSPWTPPRTARIRASLEGSISRKLGPGRSRSRRTRRRPSTRSATTSRARCRCCGSLQGDVGSGKTAVAAWALAAAALAGRQAALLAPTDLLARQHLETVASLLDDLGIERDPAHGLAAGGRRGARRIEAHRTRARRRCVVGHPRAAPGVRRVRRPRARRGGRAAPVRRGAARGARGQGRPGRAARPADDRDPDPADARPGAVRGPRRVDAAHRARGPDRDPDRHPAPRRPREDVEPRPRRGGRGTPDVRRRPADRAGGGAAGAAAGGARTPAGRATTSCPTRTWRRRGPRPPRPSSSA